MKLETTNVQTGFCQTGIWIYTVLSVGQFPGFYSGTKKLMKQVSVTGSEDVTGHFHNNKIKYIQL